ncbi:MAG: hypothetical protein MZV49_27460 [Rhodopseudomonas palustris]|nr:hypothetical protein [Rhodopseudomonas palustris]
MPCRSPPPRRATSAKRTSPPKCSNTKREIATAKANEEGKPEAIIPRRSLRARSKKFKDEVRADAPGLHPR